MQALFCDTIFDKILSYICAVTSFFFFFCLWICYSLEFFTLNTLDLCNVQYLQYAYEQYTQTLKNVKQPLTTIPFFFA